MFAHAEILRCCRHVETTRGVLLCTACALPSAWPPQGLADQLEYRRLYRIYQRQVIGARNFESHGDDTSVGSGVKDNPTDPSATDLINRELFLSRLDSHRLRPCTIINH